MAKLHARGRTVEATLTKTVEKTGLDGVARQIIFTRAVCSDGKVLEKFKVRHDSSDMKDAGFGEWYCKGYTVKSALKEGVTVGMYTEAMVAQGWAII